MAPSSGVFLLVMLTMSMLAGAALLFWTWLANREERLALYGAHGFLLAAAGVLLISLRGLVPLSISIVLGNGCVVAGSTLLYAGICLFNGRQFPRLVVIGCPIIFLAALNLPAVLASGPLRFSAASLLSAAVYGLSAIEVLHRRDGLRSRVPLAFALGGQCLFSAVRVPIAIFADPPIFTLEGYWIAVIAVETMIFTQVISYLVISLPKERLEQALQRAALTDSLTGLPNRRAFYDVAHHVISLSGRHPRSICLILFDLDRFKQLNDSHGHAAGDAALIVFAEVLTGSLRTSDYCGRIGGEEFGAILLETTETEARAAAERVVANFGSQPVDHAGRKLHVTVSAGVVCCADGAMGLDDLFARADEALYCAKQAGRNRVAVAPIAQTQPSIAI